MPCEVINDTQSNSLMHPTVSIVCECVCDINSTSLDPHPRPLVLVTSVGDTHLFLLIPEPWEAAPVPSHVISFSYIHPNSVQLKLHLQSSVVTQRRAPQVPFTPIFSPCVLFLCRVTEIVINYMPTFFVVTTVVSQ
jgi:hypothetical protein